MKCEKHINEEAVAQCQNCGSYLCQTCSEATADAKESFGSLCLDCYKEKLVEMGSFYYEKKKKTKSKLIFSIVTFAIGLVIAAVFGIQLLADSTNSEALTYFIIGYALCGVLPAWNAWKKATEEKDEHDRIHGATYKVNANGDVVRDTDLPVKLVVVLFTLVFGPLASIVTWFSLKGTMSECDNNLSYASNEIEKIEAMQ